jgi:microcystin-dependent protein
VIGQTGGSETVTINTNQLPAHTHTAVCSTIVGNTTDPTNNYWAVQPALIQYATPASTVLMKNTAIATNGGGQAHGNMIPYETLFYVIAVEGVFPSRN